MSVLLLVLVIGCDSDANERTGAVLPFLNASETAPIEAEPAHAILNPPSRRFEAPATWVPDTRKKARVALVGTYSCELRSNDLPLGPFKLPQFGCRIFKDESGVLLVETIRGIASLDGMIRKTSDGGFRVIGHFRFPGHQLRIDVAMSEQSDRSGRYEGTAAGPLNSDRRELKNYSLVMAKV